MNSTKPFFRFLVGLLLLASLALGGLGRAGLSALAAPVRAVSADAGKVVISEFRTIGPNGGTDEFIELYNRTNASIDISGWEIRASSGCGTGITNVATIGSATLLAGQRYLLGNSNGYPNVAGLDQFYTADIANDGGIALLDAGNDFVDQVGMCDTTTYKEYDIANPLYLSPLADAANQSYARKNNGCTDTDDNYADFALQSPSGPQNSSAAPVQCLRVTNVTSSTGNGTYSAGQFIQVDVEFSSNVNVTGTPILLLETGTVNPKAEARYDFAISANVLAFTYEVRAGDVSADLDYVGTNSLSLNGGTITGAVGDADLTLPVPGTGTGTPGVDAVGSLGYTQDIVINNSAAPELLSFERHLPTTALTSADSLVFRATFSEPVTGVDVNNDFSVNGSTANVADVLAVNPVTRFFDGAVFSTVYDVTVSGGNLPSFEGDVGLDLDLAQDIEDGSGTLLPAGEPAVDEVYTLDNSSPNVTVDQAGTQADPADGPPVNFTVIFNEKIDPSTFTADDITQNGSIPSSLITWEIIDSGDQMEFTLSAAAVYQQTGTLRPSIAAGRVQDLAGNGNTASTSADNTVTFNDNVRPTVKVNQAGGQPDPATSLPVTFSVEFNEPIIPSIFTLDDITQTGTATGVTWNITDTGDHTIFILEATATTGYGTLEPSIAANRVTDPAGNNNEASTSTDNIVDYILVPTSTPTATPTPTNMLSVVISEIAWAGTKASSDDEWIELYNPKNTAVDITGWILRTSDNSPYIILSGTIGPKEYFLLEHSDDDTVFDVTADMLYTGSLSNIGEVVYLYDDHGSLIDTANKNGGYWPAGNYYTWASMERGDIIPDSDFAWVTYDPKLDKNKDLAHDANGNVIQGTPGRGNLPFKVTATVTPTRTATPVRGVSRFVQPEDVLIINEFLPRPGRDWNQDGLIDVNDEFIEVINAGTTNVNLRGYRLDDDAAAGQSNPYTLPNMTLKPGERAVFYGSETGILLNDSGDTVRLIKTSGSKVVDAYTYGVVRYPDESWCRMPDGEIGSQFWNHPCFPTPNNPNALTGRFPGTPGYAIGINVCFMPDGAPQDFVQAECVFTNGRGIWNRTFWDGFWKSEIYLLTGSSKWGTFFQ